MHVPSAFFSAWILHTFSFYNLFFFLLCFSISIPGTYFLGYIEPNNYNCPLFTFLLFFFVLYFVILSFRCFCLPFHSIWYVLFQFIYTLHEYCSVLKMKRHPLSACRLFACIFFFRLFEAFQWYWINTHRIQTVWACESLWCGYGYQTAIVLCQLFTVSWMFTFFQSNSNFTA